MRRGHARCGEEGVEAREDELARLAADPPLNRERPDVLAAADGRSPVFSRCTRRAAHQLYAAIPSTMSLSVACVSVTLSFSPATSFFTAASETVALTESFCFAWPVHIP